MRAIRTGRRPGIDREDAGDDQGEAGLEAQAAAPTNGSAREKVVERLELVDADRVQRGGWDRRRARIGASRIVRNQLMGPPGR